MVLMNSAKKARNQASLVNQNQGGGMKKAGLPPTMAMTQWRWINYNKPFSGANGILNLTNMRKNRFKTFPNQNLPINMPGRGFIFMH